MPDINWLAVLAAALSAFLLGGLWYSPAMFQRAWQRGSGLTDEQLQKGGHPGKVYGGAFVLSLVALTLVTRHGPPWQLVLLTTREWLLAGLLALRRLFARSPRPTRLRYTASLLGKATTVAQFLALLSLLTPAPPGWQSALCGVASGLGVLAVAGYVRRAAEAKV